ncbi:MAG: MFS transporter [Pseudomonadota bacterium]|nr:MFS transporter [Pseudomonadota bacterium]
MHEQKILSINKDKVSTSIGMIIVALAAIFYCYEYLLRVAPSVMNQELMAHYNINDFQLGSLTAYYYYIYAPMQIPVGLLMDRYGPKTLMIIACLSCAVGSYLFVFSDILLLAKVGRFLVGFGSSFAFVGVLKLATLLLPQNHFAVVCGATAALGQIGAILGDILLTAMIRQSGWQNASINAAIFGLILTFGLAITFRFASKQMLERKCTKEEEEDITGKGVIKTFFELTKNIDLWKTSIIGCLFWVPIAVFAEYIGIDFLKAAYNFSSEQAAMANSMIFFGMATGGPLLTGLSNKLQSRLFLIKIGGFVSATSIALVIFCTSMPGSCVYALLYLTGIATSSKVIVFPMAKELSSKKASGTAIGITNMTIMVAGVLFQPLTGFLLNQTTAINNIHSGADFQYALSYIPFVIAISSVIAFTTKETYRAEENEEMI